ncbi:hypothetical protein [Streptomyces sp. PSKA30]|nr:hypothetical protein [Streptomyces sp. PSKA30]
MSDAFGFSSAPSEVTVSSEGSESESEPDEPAASELDESAASESD